MWHAFLIFVGGGLGAVGRHFVGLATLRQFGPHFPYGTMIVNILGSLIMGIFIGWLVKRGGTSDARLFVATGVLGGFTTFSAFSLDAANLIERGATMQAFTYVLITVIACLVAVFVGLTLARGMAG